MITLGLVALIVVGVLAARSVSVGAALQFGAKAHAAACTRDVETVVAFHRATTAALLSQDAHRRAS